MASARRPAMNSAIPIWQSFQASRAGFRSGAAVSRARAAYPSAFSGSTIDATHETPARKADAEKVSSAEAALEAADVRSCRAESGRPDQKCPRKVAIQQRVVVGSSSDGA